MSDHGAGWERRKDEVSLAIIGVLSFWILLIIVNWAASRAPLWEAITAERKTLSWWKAYNYVLFFPLHVVRSLKGASGNSNFASSSETDYLVQKEGVFSKTVMEFLCIRRSQIIVSIAFTIGSFISSVLDVKAARQNMDKYQSWSNVEDANGKPIKLEAFIGKHPSESWTVEDPDAWKAYSQMVIQGIMGKLLGQATFGVLLAHCCTVACWVGTLCCCLYGIARWQRFYQSKTAILVGWFLAQLAPFIVTCLPVRLLVDWSKIDSLVETYASELSVHLGDKSLEVASKIVDECSSFIGEAAGKRRDLGEKVKTICFLQGLFTNKKGIIQCCPFTEVFKVDVSVLKSVCPELRKDLLSDDSKSQAIFDAVAKVCKNKIMPLSTEYLRMGFDGGLQYYSTLMPVMQWLKSFAMLSFGFSTGLSQLFKLLPEVIGLTTAILKGALKTKTLAPQSTIPGMFLQLLPILIAPIWWVLVSILYQVLGSGWILLGLSSFAFAPMVQSLICVIFNASQPMTDARVATFSKALMAQTAAYIFAGVGFCVYFYQAYTRDVQVEGFTLESDLVQKKSREFSLNFGPSGLLIALSRILGKMVFTTVTSCDWVLAEIGQQRRFEVLLEISAQLEELDNGVEDDETVLNWPKGLQTPQEREELRKVAAQRQRRLDCVSWILYHEMPMNEVARSEVSGDSDRQRDAELASFDQDQGGKDLPTDMRGGRRSTILSAISGRSGRRSTVRSWPAEFSQLRPPEAYYEDAPSGLA